jgi:DNA replication protein DnaC
VGRGKSYTAACIVNALIEKEVRAKMVNLAALVNEIQTLGADGRSRYILSYKNGRTD